MPTLQESQSWNQQFGYDRYGNRTSFSQTLGGVTTNTTPSVDAATNRFSAGQGFSYDASGNAVQDTDPMTGNVRSFAFDGENKQREVKDVTNSNHVVGTYFYDGDGRRVKKVTDTETTIFVYDAAGKLVAEYSNATPAATPQVSYTTTDHLGSPRILTDQTGAVISRRDFLPFGQEINPGIGSRSSALNYGSDSVRQKFTGYERDSETDLDFAQARMYANRLGRFMNPDPLFFTPERVYIPQRFNVYVYVGNNPLSAVDPDGEKILQLGEDAVANLEARIKELKKQLKADKHNAELKAQLAEAKSDLAFTKEGNRVVSAMIEALQKRGEGKGYKVEDFNISTNPVADMKEATEAYNAANPTSRIDVDLTVSLVKLQGTNALTIGTSIYLFTDRSYYQQSLLLLSGQKVEAHGFGTVGRRDGISAFATALSHEKKHATDGANEKEAYKFQLKVLENMNKSKPFKNQTFFNYFKGHLTSCRDNNGNC